LTIGKSTAFDFGMHVTSAEFTCKMVRLCPEPAVWTGQ